MQPRNAVLNSRISILLKEIKRASVCGNYEAAILSLEQGIYILRKRHEITIPTPKRRHIPKRELPLDT